MANNNVKWRLENGVLTVEIYGTLHAFLSKEEKSKIRKIVISEGCSRIGGWVFAGCENVTDVILPLSLRIIAEYAFLGCSRLKTIALPENLIGLCEGAFCGCAALEMMKLPRNIHTLPRHVFRDCGGMKKLILPDLVQRIDKWALKCCGAEIVFREEEVLVQNDLILWKKTKKVAWHLSDGNGTVNLDFNRLSFGAGFPGEKLVSYDIKTCDWNQQKPVHGAQCEITVSRPFCCRVEDSFWVEYLDNQFVRARLLSIMKTESISAQIRIVVLNVVSLWEFVGSVSEDKKKCLQDTHCYDVGYLRGDLEIPFCRQIAARMIEVYNVLDGGDFQYLYYIYTDDDGIDHLIMKKHDGEASVGDVVLGYHKYFPFPVKI